MSSDEFAKALEAINTPLVDGTMQLQSGLAPLQEFLSQQEKLKELLDVRPMIPNMQEFKLPEFELPVNSNLASEFHKRLVEWIQDFDNTLDQEHEVGVRLVSFGQAVTFHLKDMGYWNPSLISFKGMTDQGEPVELIQHVSQISILLIKVQRKDISQPKRPIGFSMRETEAHGET